MRMLSILGLAIGLAAAGVRAAGPDIIVGDIPNMDDFGSLGDTAGLAMATTSCNKGDGPISWKALPYSNHPVIAQNMYRLKDGRMTQIGMSWLKHGFFAEQGTVCFNDCQADNTGRTLGVHCSDPYSASFNSGPLLGKRSEVNPSTGVFDGATANNHTGHTHTGISHRLQVKHADLGNAGASYFAEAIYIAADDIAAGNANNNAGYRQFSVSGSSSNWSFTSVGATARESVALSAWTGATRVNIDLPVDGRLIVSYKVTDLGGGQWRYDYAVMNFNSNRGVQGFSVPVGAANITNIGFSAPLSHDEGLSNVAWPAVIAGGRITWACESYATNVNANAIRWGTMYNFWFDANVGPVTSAARMDRFKPGYGGPQTFAVVSAPAASDDNNNGIADALEITGGAPDCNGNGIPDSAELVGADCNNNGIPDVCELAGHDCNGNGRFDACETGVEDCDGNGVPDNCELAAHDCNGNGVHDACELPGHDCNANGVLDACESDCDADGIIDACEGVDCNANGVADSCDIGGSSGGPRTYASGPVNILTKDEATVFATLNCPLTANVTDVNVLINLNHTFDGDVQLKLSHNATVVLLYDRAGGSGQNFVNTLLDSDASNGISSAPPPYTGAFTPVEDLAAFDNASAAGLWTLQINDNRVQDSGVLLNWSLIVSTTPGAPTSVDANHNGIPDECDICPCKGDMNADHALNGRDISGFVRAFTTAFSPCADMNNSGTLTTADITAFVNKLLQASPPCP